MAVFRCWLCVRAWLCGRVLLCVQVWLVLCAGLALCAGLTLCAGLGQCAGCSVQVAVRGSALCAGCSVCVGPGLCAGFSRVCRSGAVCRFPCAGFCVQVSLLCAGFGVACRGGRSSAGLSGGCGGSVRRGASARSRAWGSVLCAGLVLCAGFGVRVELVCRLQVAVCRIQRGLQDGARPSTSSSGASGGSVRSLGGCASPRRSGFAGMCGASGVGARCVQVLS